MAPINATVTACTPQLYYMSGVWFVYLLFVICKLLQAVRAKESMYNALQSERIHCQWLQQQLTEAHARTLYPPDPDLHLRPAGPAEASA